VREKIRRSTDLGELFIVKMKYALWARVVLWERVGRH
jgi:hypothetical protein